MFLSELKVLSKDEIDRIHLSSLEVLNTVGVHFSSKRVLDFLSNFKGIKIDRSSGIVKISSDTVSSALKSLPQSFKLFSLDKCNSLIIGKKNHFQINGHCAAFILDANMKRKRIVKKDVENFAILSNFLENINIVGIEGLPEDIENEKYSFIEAAKLTLLNTLKPFHYTPEYIFEDYFVKEIIKIITNSKDLNLKPSAICMLVILSPLSWPREISEILLRNSIEGIPIAIMTSPYSGVSAPYSIAGQITTFNSEILSGIVLNQLANPGSPVIYGCSCATFDMKESTVNVATPETALMRIATAQMAKYYNIPSITSAPDTDSNCLDEQNGWEKITTLFSSFASGINLIVNAGLFSTGTTVNYGQAVIDSEIAGYVKRILEGIEIDDNRISLDEIKKIGPLGSFLMSEKTLGFLRDGEHEEMNISNRKVYTQWEKLGKIHIERKANKKALKIIKENKPKIPKKDLFNVLNKIYKNIDQKKFSDY